MSKSKQTNNKGTQNCSDCKDGKTGQNKNDKPSAE